MAHRHKIKELEAQLSEARQLQADAEADALEAETDARGFEARLVEAQAEIAKLAAAVASSPQQPVAPARKPRASQAVAGDAKDHGAADLQTCKNELRDCRQELQDARADIKRLTKELKLAEARCEAGR